MGNLTYYEFFCGGGMARAGLGAQWTCLFANDFDPMKAASYAANWGDPHLVCEDIAKIPPASLTGAADLAWASFPCQDLSLAGVYAGLGAAAALERTRSGTFWAFWSLVEALRAENRAPKMVVLENVYGVLTSNKGRDFAAIGKALARAGYRFGALLVDAVHFVPQSRPRVFIVAVDENLPIPAYLKSSEPTPLWHPRALVNAAAGLSPRARAQWLWWRLPEPSTRNVIFADLVEDDPAGVVWRSEAETQQLLAMMTPLNLAKVEAAKRKRRRIVGSVYKRTRHDPDGTKRQRAEVRFDDIAGCLRTPSGGSSRQTILVVKGARVRSRLLSPREAARLMGLPDDYKLPARYNDAYHLAGDGVCVPAVRHIASHLLEPILLSLDEGASRAAAE